MEIGNRMRNTTEVKSWCGIFLAAILSLNAMAGETAYQALRTLRGDRGQEAMRQVVQVEGDYGQTQPSSWTIYLSDPLARGGVREVVVQKNQISSERTPVRGFGWVRELEPLDFSRLNLDSDGAFKVANKEAIDRRVGFDSINYELLSDESSGSPIWDLTLYNNLGKLVGRIRISAENGKIVRPLSVDAGSVAPYTFDEPTRPQPSRPRSGTSEESNRGGVIGRVETIGTRTAETLRDTTLRIGGTIEEFLTGDRTIDQQSND